MSVTHTPGKWSYEADMRPDGREGEGEYLAGWNITSANGEIVGIEGIIPDDTGKALANARLIAAAPCLLEALTITRSQVALLGRLTDPVTSDVLSIADAAIAKARGES